MVDSLPKDASQNINNNLEMHDDYMVLLDYKIE
jgi:hypothetical protein